MINDLKQVLLEPEDIDQSITTISEKIIQTGFKMDEILLVGLRTRGYPIAKAIQKRIEKLSKSKPHLGVLDISLYRDDLSEKASHPIVKDTELPVDIAGRYVFLVDDVLYTGRTVRAALNALFDYGRPKRVFLAVLIDRLGRELPIQSDFTGLTYEAKPHENVKVKIKEIDGEDRVVVLECENS